MPAYNSRRGRWSGGSFDDDGKAVDVTFPGFGVLEAAFPACSVLANRTPARVTYVLLTPPDASPMPPAIADGVVATLRSGFAVAVFAANHAELRAGLAAIQAARVLADICRSISGNRK
jgi:hypothetical protein